MGKDCTFAGRYWYCYFFCPQHSRASLSAAKKKWVPFDAIMSTAGWSDTGTFKAYYDKPVRDGGSVTYGDVSGHTIKVYCCSILLRGRFMLSLKSHFSEWRNGEFQFKIKRDWPGSWSLIVILIFVWIRVNHVWAKLSHRSWKQAHKQGSLYKFSLWIQTVAK